MPFYNWSTTAASNATADSTCPFPEGMAPSAVNDGVRALMARVREWGNDISGAIVTTGTSTAYAVTTFQGFSSLSVLGGDAIAFTPHATCGATVTLNVDGLGARPLRTSPGAELQAGTLVQGTPYVAIYNATDGAFYLQGFFGNPYNIPLGGMMPFLSTTAPNSSFVLPYGQAISRTTYSSLFAMTGTAFGSGDGSTTFNIPDLRGRILAGLDNMGGSAASRITPGGSGIAGTTIGAAGGAETVTLTSAQIPSHQHNVYLKDPGHLHSLATNSVGVANGSFYVVMQYDTSNNPKNTSTSTTGMTIGSVNGTANDNQTAAAGGGGAHSNMPPALIVPWILRVI